MGGGLIVIVTKITTLRWNLDPDRKYNNQHGSDDRKEDKQEEKGQNRRERGLIRITLISSV